MDYSKIPERVQAIYDTCNELEKTYLFQILQELSDTGYSKTYEDIWLSDYKEIPVSIDSFIKEDLYLGKATRNGNGIYPYWWSVYRDLFAVTNRYQEVVFTGATRIGKTSTAITCVAYMLYRLMCYKDPQAYFNKKDVSIFSIFFFNVTKELAKSVAFREFNDTLAASPWFMQHGGLSKSERNFYYIPEGGKIAVDYGSDSSHGLGQQIWTAVMDEANFSRAGVKDVNKAKQHMLDVYNTISARIKGTFRKGGQVYGKLFSVSSKKSDNDFLEMYVQQQQSSGAGDGLYVCDKPQWEVLPPGTFSSEKFYIAIGDRYKRGFVMSDTQSTPQGIAELEAQGYQILTPPLDMKPEFVADFDIALRDLAGISIPGALSFISQEVLSECIDGTRTNPFLQEILKLGTKDTFTLEEFFHMENVNPSHIKAPMFIHLDLSLNTDRTGISGVAVTGRRNVEIEPGKFMSMPEFTHIFSIALEAPVGDKIPYAKIVAFICWLRRKGFNIYGISRDQFQSEYLAQILEEQGFTVDKISLDRTPDGYIALRSVLSEHRINMLDCQLLQDELINLQRDAVTGKVDHLIGGSKDVSDSFAGAIWNAIMKDIQPTSIPANQTARLVSSINGRRKPAHSSELSSMFSDLYSKYRR